ncbi:MAG TPA: nucleotidyl transferase AbiEii/AbiGii toxin family protein [Pyrinomonadaceae bacterium]|nr:nucleotidyl transferase AbiEii/AbiGii toxin family protein [Pyrinomonadaceae bacterium]
MEGEKFKTKLSPEERKEWNEIIKSGVRAQELIEGSIAVGGTAAALYAEHRISRDTDHLLMSLKENFDEILERLSEAPEWKLARIRKPVLILGSINDVEVGFRQSKRVKPIETEVIKTDYGNLTVPTLDELIGMKAYLAYSRNTTRDYLDFAALSECATEEEVLDSLLKLDERYGETQTSSVGLEVAKALTAAEPFDLGETDLSNYKALAPEWHDWSKVEKICRRFGVLLGEKLIYASPTSENREMDSGGD